MYLVLSTKPGSNEEKKHTKQHRKDTAIADAAVAEIFIPLSLTAFSCSLPLPHRRKAAFGTVVA